MRKNFIIIGILLVVVIAGLVIAWEAFSYKNVQFKLKGKEYVVDIYNEDEKKVSSVSDSGVIKIKEGPHSYRVSGDKYNGEAVEFSVKGNDTVVEIYPQYSNGYLLDLLRNERSSIEAILSSTYQTQKYTIQTLRLYQQGQWAAGTLNVSRDPRQLPDTYRFVLQKVNDIWMIVVPPQIAVNKTQYKNVPEAILYSLYTDS